MRLAVAWLPALLPAACAAPRQDASTTRPAPASRGTTALEIAGGEEAQWFGVDWDVAGLRLTFAESDNRTMHGLDLGLGVARVAGDAAGLAATLVAHEVRGSFTGIEVAGVLNSAGWHAEGSDQTPPRMAGLQLALGMNRAASALGAQVGGINLAGGGSAGLQLGMINGMAAGAGLQAGALGNMAMHELRGVQLGGVFSVARRRLAGVQLAALTGAEDFHGLQAGVVNLVQAGDGLQLGALNVSFEDLRGVQFGLFNVAQGGVQIGLVNWNQQGFLPVFPLVNF